MTKKLILLSSVFIILFTANASNAQSYKTGIGFRLGGISSGISVKHFMGSTGALEGILSFGSHYAMITGLYEKHTAFPKAEGLNWFFGGGAHVGFYSDKWGYRYFYYKHHGNGYKIEEVDYYDNRSSFGLDFILGLDYKFKNVPINLSLDVKPFFDITPGFYGYWEPGLSFRFTL
jgi:hypothetical protein